MAGKKSGNKNFYAVVNGRLVGIFTDWFSTDKSVKRFRGNSYKGFDDINTAANHLILAGFRELMVHDNGHSCLLEEYLSNGGRLSEDTTGVAGDARLFEDTTDGAFGDRHSEITTGETGGARRYEDTTAGAGGTKCSGDTPGAGGAQHSEDTTVGNGGVRPSATTGGAGNA